MRSTTPRWLFWLVLLTALPGCYSQLSGCDPVVRLFAPASEPLDAPIRQHLQRGIESGRASFDHDRFDRLLARHADPQAGRVDYRGLADDRPELEAYLQRVADVDPADLGRDAQLALLINAYNACTLRLILDHYPAIDSIKDISDPWGRPICTVGGAELTLDEIEHNLIRPLYKDPRIHFAVNCAAVGCPPLDDAAYRGEAIDRQLEAAARRTLRSDRYLRLEGGTLRLLRILLWYRDDFIDEQFHGSADTIPAYVAEYATPEVGAFIDEHDGDPPIAWLEYDWSLNDLASNSAPKNDKSRPEE